MCKCDLCENRLSDRQRIVLEAHKRDHKRFDTVLSSVECDRTVGLLKNTVSDLLRAIGGCKVGNVHSWVHESIRHFEEQIKTIKKNTYNTNLKTL